MATPAARNKKKNRKVNRKTARGGGFKYIERCGSPILRKNIIDEFNENIEKFVSSQGWKAFCDRAFFVYRLMHRKDAVAIAANQLNYPYPAFIWTYEGKFEIVLMPTIDIIDGHEADNWTIGTEGCLSVDEGVSAFDVYRANDIILRGFDHFGVPIEPRHLSGYEARVVQHEVDHLCGRLVIDYLKDSKKKEFLDGLLRGRHD